MTLMPKKREGGREEGREGGRERERKGGRKEGGRRRRGRRRRRRQQDGVKTRTPPRKMWGKSGLDLHVTCQSQCFPENHDFHFLCLNNIFLF